MEYTEIPGIPGKLVTDTQNGMWDELCLSDEYSYVGGDNFQNICDNRPESLACPICVNYCADNDPEQICYVFGKFTQPLISDLLSDNRNEPNLEWTLRHNAAIVICYDPILSVILPDKYGRYRDNAYINLCSDVGSGSGSGYDNDTLTFLDTTTSVTSSSTITHAHTTNIATTTDGKYINTNTASLSVSPSTTFSSATNVTDFIEKSLSVTVSPEESNTESVMFTPTAISSNNDNNNIMYSLILLPVLLTGVAAAVLGVGMYKLCKHKERNTNALDLTTSLDIYDNAQELISTNSADNVTLIV